jgi:hypothetical protein
MGCLLATIVIVALYPFGAQGRRTGTSNAAIQNAIDETYAPVVAAVTTLPDAYVADGSVRPGLDRPTSCC